MGQFKLGPTPGFMETVEEEALARGISSREIRRWRERVPARLVEATERGEFDGGVLAKGLLRPGYWSEAIDVETPMARRRWHAMEDVLSGIVRAVRADGRDVALLYIPSQYQLDPRSHSDREPGVSSGVRVEPSWLTTTTEAQRRMRSFAESRSVAFLDTTEPLRDAVGRLGSLHWELDGHLTARGNQALAEIIAAWIRRDSVLGIVGGEDQAPGGR